MFKNSHKCLLFKNWAKSGFLFVKDIYDNQGQFISENECLRKLNCRRNWMIEYLILKSTINTYGKSYDTSMSKYINITNKTLQLKKGNKLYPLEKQKSRLFYDFLVETKFCRTYMEKSWERKFDVSLLNSKWADIYMQTVHMMPAIIYDNLTAN